MGQDTDDLEVLRLAREQGLITESQLDQIISERDDDTGRRTKSPTRMAIEKGVITEEVSQDLATQAWVKRLPRQLGDYRLGRMLGRGGMAVVFKARDVSLGKVVAVKILLPEFGSSDTYLARFDREARIAAMLTHPNTVQVFAAGAEESVHYLVMEWIEGETLSDVIRERGRFPEAEALDIVGQLCGALDEAAGMGIVHRDIKPGNILLSKWGIPKLADFGIAKELGDIHDPRIQLSLTMGVVGTPTYMSPEQARGARDIDFRSDIYSLGTTLYHMVVGEVPFGADTPQETMVRVVSESPRPPRSVRRDLSEGTAAVICRMMAKDPGERYESYDELMADLGAARHGEEVSMDYDDAVLLLRPRRRDDAYDEDEDDDEDYEPAAEGNWVRAVAIAAGIALVGLILMAALRGC